MVPYDDAVCGAISTDAAYSAKVCPILTDCMVLCCVQHRRCVLGYAVPGTDAAYDAVAEPEKPKDKLVRVCATLHAMGGTNAAYGAMRCLRFPGLCYVYARVLWDVRN
eukprot:581678-Rhodomonas_salina.1